MKKFAGIAAAALLTGSTIAGLVPSTAFGAVHAKVKEEAIAVNIYPASKPGPDKIKHDAFDKTNFKLVKGEPVVFTIRNYDGGPHSMTAGAIGFNVIIKGQVKTGVPSITTYKFTPKQTGSFHWQCVLQCDGQAKGWAMMHDGYMAGTITVVK